jgi:hypothetical protein
MKASERFKQHYLQPMPQGSGLPMVSSGEYKGLILSEDVQRRITEYRNIPSLTEADIARMLK